MALFSILSEERTPEYFPPLGSNLKVLLIWPKFPPSFWGFEGVLRMLPEAAMTPPLGLITVAALCPSSWSLRLLDRAFDAIRDEDYRWADLVMVSSMHAQRVDTLAIDIGGTGLKASVLDDTGEVVGPIEAFLAHLQAEQ